MSEVKTVLIAVGIAVAIMVGLKLSTYPTGLASVPIILIAGIAGLAGGIVSIYIRSQIRVA